mgnify:CR=1 FL=1
MKQAIGSQTDGYKVECNSVFGKVMPEYMKRDLYHAGYKAFNRGETESHYTTDEWDAIWKQGWESARIDSKSSDC